MANGEVVNVDFSKSPRRRTLNAGMVLESVTHLDSYNGPAHLGESLGVGYVEDVSGIEGEEFELDREVLVDRAVQALIDFHHVIVLSEDYENDPDVRRAEIVKNTCLTALELHEQERAIDLAQLELLKSNTGPSVA